MNYAVKNIYGKIKNGTQAVSVPGSKSITARALLMAALAAGKSTLYGIQFSDDCRTFIEAVKSLGISVEEDGTTVNIVGCGGVLPRRKAEIYVGSAGTAARFLTALAAFQDGEYTLTSSEQMKKRPQKPLICALQSAGASFEFSEEEYCFPFTVKGTTRPKSEVTVDISKSSQFLSALLIASTCSVKPLKINVVGSHGRDYVEMTVDMMWSFGVNVEESGSAYTVFGKFLPKRYEIEPDVSAACYFSAMNRILVTDIRVKGLMPRSMQGDTAFINLIKNFDGGEVDMSSCSDQALTLAAIAPYFSRPTHITGIKHIRGQECDRIKAMAVNLSAMGIKCEEEEGEITIYPSAPKPAHINTFGDHRVAMSFALTGLRADGIVIENAEVCSKTFKEYFSVLDDLVKKMCR